MSWKTVRLGDVATFVNGYAFKPSDWSEAGLEIIRIQNLTKGSSETNFFKGSIPEKYKVVYGDILISWSATLDIFVWNGTDAWLNQHIFKVVFDKVEIDKNYFIYAIKNILDDMRKQVHGATMQHITKGKFDNLEIPLPPLATQKRIAEILDAADALRRKDQELLKKYDELAQAIFIDMFGDPVKNEKGWDIKKLSEILDVDSKSVDPNKLDEYNYIGLEHIEKDTGKVLTIDKGKVVSNKFVFTKDHILYGKLRPYLNKVAIPDFNGICSTDIIPLKPKNKLLKEFLVSILRSKEFVNHSNTNAVGANLPRANKEIILNFKTIVPKLDTIGEYSKNINLINLQKKCNDQNQVKSESLFNSLIQKAFKGELV